MDADAVRKQKDRAADLVARGRLPAALEGYRNLLRELPGDLSVRQKVANLLNRTGAARAAIAEYDAVVQAYAERGELLKAISIAKVILQIDPAHRATEARLAELYSRQMGEGPRFATSAPILGRPAPAVGSAPRVSHPPLPANPFAPVAPVPLLSITPGAPLPDPNEPTRILRAAPPEKAVYLQVEPEEAPPVSGSGETFVRAIPPPEPAPLAPSTRPKQAAPVARLPTSPVPEVRPPSGRQLSVRPARPPRAAIGSDDDDDAEPTARTLPTPPLAASSFNLPEGIEDPSELHLEAIRDTEARQTGNFPVWRGPTLYSPAKDVEVEHETIQGMVPIPFEPSSAGEDASLPKIPLFSGVPREAFMALVTGAQVRTASAGERLLVEGSPGDSLFAIVQGLVTLRKLEGKRERLFAAMGPGEFFGELSVVSEAPRLATAVAEDDTVLLEFPREQLQPILQEHAAVREELTRLSQQRLFTTLVRATPLFDALDPGARTRLQAALELRVVQPGEQVVEYGQRPSGLYVVLRGRLGVVDPEATASATGLPELEEGDLFGVLSSLLGEPMKASVGARNASVLVQIPATLVSELLPTQRVMRQILAALARERWNAISTRRSPPPNE